MTNVENVVCTCGVEFDFKEMIRQHQEKNKCELRKYERFKNQ